MFFMLYQLFFYTLACFLQNTNSALIFSALVTLLWPDSSIHTVPNLQWFNLRFFDFAIMQKQYAFSRNLTSNFGLFPGKR